MKWSDVGQLVSESAPLLGALLTSPISAPIAVISLITAALGLKPSSSPEQVYSAIQADPEAIYKLSQLQLNNHIELEKIYTKFEQTQSNNIRHIMFKEYSIDNKFKSYWRPLFGYMTVCMIPILSLWLLSMVTYVFFFDPMKITLLEAILNLISSPLYNLLGLCIGVLGVNIFHRSKDKASLLGTENKNIITNITDIFKRK